MLWKLLEICVLRAGPQDLPGTPRFLALTLSGYFLVDVLISRLSFSMSAAIGVSALDLLLLAALAGTGQLLGLLALPLIHALTVAQASGEPATALAVAWLAVLVWSLLVLGHILRHALSVSLMTGVGVGVLYSLVSVMIVRVVFPEGG